MAQELGDADLYNYDVLVKLLSDRFDPASRVSAFRSRFHGRARRHHEDTDTFADALAKLCRVGYPQSPAELRQELIAEQFVRGQSDPELKKYLHKMTGNFRHSLKFAQISPACRHLPTYTDRQSRHLPYTNRGRMIAPQKKCLQWATVPHGRTGDHQRRPEYPHSNRCSLKLSEWDMRCDPSADRLMLRVSSLEVDHLSARTGGSVPSHELDGITRSFGALVVASLVTCSHVVPNRTRPCRSNQLVGSSSLKETDKEMDEIRRKTHPRPGLHPPCSTRASFDPHSSFTHQIIMGFIITE